MTQKVGQNIDFTSITNSVKNGKFDPTQLATMVGGQSYSDIAWFSTALQTMENGSDEQKVKTVQSMLTKALNIFSDLSTNSSSEADQKIDNTNKAIDHNNKQAEATFDSVNKTLQSILSRCDGCKADIDAALAEIEVLGGDSGAIANAQQQLQEKLKIIEAQKEILNNPDSDAKARKTAIDTILNTVSAIYTLSDSVKEYKELLEKQTDIVNGATQEVDSLASQMQTVVEDGVKDTQSAMENVTAINTEVGQQQVESGEKTLLGGKQIAAGTEMEAGPQAVVTGATGAELIASGTDKVNAGRKLMKGAIDSFKLLGQSQSNISNGLSDFVNFSQGIGQYSTGILELAGAYNTSASEMITSVGSWTKVEEANKALETYTNEYSQEVGHSPFEEKDSEDKEIKYKNFEFDTKEFGVELDA